MSKQEALIFLDKIENDKRLKMEFLSAKDEKEFEKKKKKHDLNFTRADLNEAFKEKYHTMLSSKELLKVVGMGNPACVEGGCAVAKQKYLKFR